MRYNFHCLGCKTDFRKDTKLKMIDTPYGKQEGIKCPLCKGKAKAMGIATYIGGESPNGIHNSTKMLEL